MSLYQTKDSTVRHCFGFFDGYSNRSLAGGPRNTGADSIDRLFA